MRIIIRAILGSFFFLFLMPAGSFCQENLPGGPAPLKDLGTQPGADSHTSSFQKISPFLFRIGEISINTEKRSVDFPAFVNMNKGLLEYVLVHQSGKTHESLLSTRVRPYDLQLALLLLGLKATEHPLSYQGESKKPEGEPVAITLSYQKTPEAEAVGVSPDKWIIVHGAGGDKTAPPLDWVFTGSVIEDGVFIAQRDGSVIALFHDPAAIVDNASPGGESDKIWFAKEAAVPPPGTPVLVTITATNTHRVVK